MIPAVPTGASRSFTMIDDNRNVSRPGAVQALILTVSLAASASAAQTELWFPPELVADGQGTADLARFRRGQQLPGRYTVDVYLNQRFVGSRKIAFAADVGGHATDPTGLVPLLTCDELIAAGVRHEAFAAKAPAGATAAGRASPASLIPQASTLFSFHKMRLDMTVPQRWIQRRPRNWTPPELWDEGITAGLLNWSFSGNNRFGRLPGASRYLQLRGGLNYGPWRVRDEMSISEYAGVRVWDHTALWAERGIPAWRSRVKIGDAVTGGRVFESLRLRGASLTTEDDMYPDSERGYAPLIRGTALSNARVSVRQRGHVIYEANVPPGEFVIDDTDPVYSSGDLEVSVREADGSVRRFTVPYATVPDLLRQGQGKYDLSAGYLQNSSYLHDARPLVVQGILMRGTAHETTLFGGLQFTRNYRAAAIGAGFNLGELGALSADVTHAESVRREGGRSRGQSLRFLYSRSVEQTGTTFQLAGYRYSTGGYFSLEESLRSGLRSAGDDRRLYGESGATRRQRTDRFEMANHRRERMEVTVSQQVQARTSLYVTGSRQTYWQRGGSTTSVQAGVSTSLDFAALSLNYSESHTPIRSGTDRGVYISLSVPLSRLLNGYDRPLSAALTLGHTGDGELTRQTVISGSALDRDALSWSAGQAHSSRSGDSSNLRLSYRGSRAQTSAGWSHGHGYRQVSYDASGGLILHGGGLTAAPYLGQTSVLIETRGVTGIPVEGGTGTVTDARGYAVQPWASEFRENRVVIDIRHLDPQTEIADPVVRVVPTRGAVVRARFAAKTGYRILMTLRRDGRPLPLGTTVSLGDSSSLVGDNGQVYLSGAERRGTLRAKWGSQRGQSCGATWDLGNITSSSVVRISADCT